MLALKRSRVIVRVKLRGVSNVIGARRAEKILCNACDCLGEMGVVTTATFVEDRLFLDHSLIFPVRL